MSRRIRWGLGLAGAAVATLAIGQAFTTRAAPKENAEAEALPKTATSHVTSVTVYQNSALVTREVEVPEGTGSFELVVTPLPTQTVNSSLYSEGTDGIQVLTTRFRMRPVKEDTREEVRKVEAQVKSLRQEAMRLQSDMRVAEQNLQTLTKLEGFTGANLQHQTEKGTLNSEGILVLCKYVMDSRGEKSQVMVGLQQKIEESQEQMEFVQRQLQELTAGSNRTERDAVIVVEKKNKETGKVRLNYLVDSASWRPQYKFRAGKENQPIQLEYLAAITQQTGEDWNNAKLILSTAEPMLHASPPDLKLLELAVVPRGSINAGLANNLAPGLPQPTFAAPAPFSINADLATGTVTQSPPRYQSSPAMAQTASPVAQSPMLEALNDNDGSRPSVAAQYDKQASDLRTKARREFSANNSAVGGQFMNDAAAFEQAKDLLVTREEELKSSRNRGRTSRMEGPSVTYHLNTRLTVPSRQDEQIIEVAKIEMTPEYFYKAVPVLTQHVYRLANLTNRSEYVLLPGEATMYIGSDFVGRATLPLVAIGEQLTAGFGVDPQLQVQRQLVDKSRSTQGDNQVLKYEYRILVSSYKSDPVKVQVWDRLPHSGTDAVSVSLVKAKPEISTDAMYVRECKPSNLLRWDLTVDSAMNGEKAKAIQYEFKLELGRQTTIGNAVNLLSK